MFNTHHLMAVKNTLFKFKPCLDFDITAFERHKYVINKQHDEEPVEWHRVEPVGPYVMLLKQSARYDAENLEERLVLFISKQE